MDNNQENNNTPEERPNPNKFNVNSYWIYGLIILGIIGINAYVNFNTQVEQIDLYSFEDKVRAGEVDKIEIVNEKLVQVYIRKEVIDAKYPKLKDSRMYGFSPHFKFTIGDIGNFENRGLCC
jgi:cell division protease FtsH